MFHFKNSDYLAIALSSFLMDVTKTGNGECEIENRKWEIENGKWKIENNGKLIFFR